MKFKGIIIRKLSQKDLKQVKKFQIFINSLIQEKAQISLNKKLTLRQETDWLKNSLKQIKQKKLVFLIAEHNNEIIGTTGINLNTGRKEHVGGFGIMISKDCRGIGLGNFLMTEIIKLAKKKLKSKIIRLSVFSINKPAISLYKKQGFKKVATIPKQLQYKGKLINEIVMILGL
ncbi:MAG: GNAT family N-acetyltransferase [Candidatus Pacebacteria bacterium]|nr:GNAT family N-acetyltransferase [Candidatus Paceibacterota bacterium]